MAAVAPFVSLRDWRASLYGGDPAIIEQFLATIDVTLPAEWVRDHPCEQTRLRPDRIRCYLFDRVVDAAVRVSLERVTATRVRGGPVEVIHHPPPGGIERIAQWVAEFADACVRRAAAATSADCTHPAFGLRSALSPAAEMLFAQLADTADGKWPLTDQAQRLWDELISCCLTEQVAIDRTEFEKWLIESGWEEAAVTSIADRFFADSEWMVKRLAVTSP